MNIRRTTYVLATAIALGLAGVATDTAAHYFRGGAPDPGDMDADGWVGVLDLAAFVDCMAGPGVMPDPPPPITPQDCLDVFDVDADGDVDWNDHGAFQALSARHVPIPLRDNLGNVLPVDSTTPFSGRRTCAGYSCHDIDRISNGFLKQTGRTDAEGNIIMQDDYFGDGRWWIRSPGKYGTWSGNTNVQTAGKDNPHESEMDNTTFGFIAHCGGCHAGGGPGEFDRDNLPLYNPVTGQFGYELLGKTAEDVRFDGDYAYIDFRGDGSWMPAPWDVTGLAEPDCLYCHRAERTWTYDPSPKDWNRQWRSVVRGARDELVDNQGQPVPAFSASTTAGQGWFSNLDIDGEGPPTLQIDYSVGVDDGSLIQQPDDTLKFSPTSLARPPGDKVCWGCHLHGGWQSKRGTVWFDERDIHFRKFTNRSDEDPDNDIPDDKAAVCNYCHPADLDHNFAKGNSPFCRNRDELDYVNMRTCRECHLTVLPNGQPNPLKHPESPDVPGDIEIHQVGFNEGENGPMKVMSCQACHVPRILATAASVRDHASTGSGITYYTDQFLSADPLDPANPNKSTWYPTLQWKEDSDGVSRLFPVKSTITIYWGEWDQNGTPGDLTDDTIRSIIAWRVRHITGGAPLPGLTDDNGDGTPEVNRPEEMLLYMEALKGNDNYGRQIAQNPVLVQGPRIWYEDPEAPEGVSSFEHEGTGIIAGALETYGLDHNVLAASEALGAGSDCQMCHRTDGQSPLFDRLILVDPWDVNGQPVYQTVREMTLVDTTSYHENIVMKDVLGNALTVDATTPYSDRQTCGGMNCHDIERISNGLIHQQGRTDADGNVIMHDDFYDDGRWWVRSSGMYGRWSGGSGGLNRQTAGKENLNESEMDMTAFYWSSFCGGCHAGGGQMEFDRDGIRLWDEATGQFGYEVLGKTEEEVALDGDYAFIDADNDGAWSMAPWDVTGVADPECLHCHRANRTYVDLQDMHREWRGAVLGTKDTLVDSQGDPVPAYSAAGTAGQGWFSTLDTEADPPVLQIDYSVGMDAGDFTVNENNELVLPAEFLARPPRDEACWGCHLPGGFQGKRGTVWFDERDVMYAGFNNLLDEDPSNDIPPHESTACNRCHPGNIDHNFAKGDSPYAKFRAELNWEGFRSCRECHLAEIDGERNPLKDPTAPDVAGGMDTTQIHFASSDNGGPLVSVSCQGCHVPYALEKANMVTDRSLTGTAETYLTDAFLSANPLDPSDPDKSTWYPAFTWKIDSDGVERLFPQKLELALYWADWDRKGTPEELSDDVIQPIILWRMRQITGNEPFPIVTDDNGDGRLEVNRPEEMLVYMKALRGLDSYGRQVAANPVLVKGERVWYFDAQSPTGVNSFEYEGTGIAVEGFEVFGLDHNVLAKAEAWGAGPPGKPPACEDCHADVGQSPVLDRLILMDPWDENGNPVYKTVREMTGAMPPPPE